MAESLTELRERAREAAKNAVHWDDMGVSKTHHHRMAGADAASDLWQPEVERLQERLDEAVRLLQSFTRCPLFGHTDSSRRRRVDCADDQCGNADHVRYVECADRSHGAVEFLARIDGGEQPNGQ